MGGKRGRLITSSDRATAVELITEANNAGARKQEACKLLNITLRTLQRWEKEQGLTDKRQRLSRSEPVNKLTQKEREMILAIANDKIYYNLPPSKIVPMLADKGVYIASESSFYRVLRKAGQLTHRGLSKKPKNNKPKAYIATSINQVWSWDISYLPSQVQGLYYYLYMIIDIYSRKIVGWSIHEKESSELASLLISQACLDENISEKQLVLHSDNGSPMKGATMIATLEKLGVVPSFSRPSVSDDNPFSESLFKTLKYHANFPKYEKFATIVGAREWVEDFVNWYNTQHLHSGIKFVTPAQRHQGLDQMILHKRHMVYRMAKLQHPDRWSGNTRDWSHIEAVSLNPNKKLQQISNYKQEDLKKVS